MKQRSSDKYITVLRFSLGAILIIAPFYTTISIWAYQYVKHLDFLKIWKEIALSLMAVIAIGFLLTHRSLAKRFIQNRLIILVGLYILLTIAIGAYDFVSGRVSHSAIIYGWLTDLRPVAVFLLALLTLAASGAERFKRFPWRKILIVPAILVILFGFLQATVLPKDFLSHFGYNQHTTLPYETVDNQPNLVRVQSTLRGPNPLGVYIMMTIVFVAGWILVEKKTKQRLLLFGLVLISLVVLYRTYSRSAELGLMISILALLAIKLRGRYARRHLVAILTIVIVASGIITAAIAPRSYTVQNVLFHSSNRSTSTVSSNTQRLQGERQGVEDIIHNPLGFGVGSAGPASRRNTKGPLRIAENSYLQIGQELGVAGLMFFMAINILVGYELWKNRDDELSSSLLASLIGITLVSMLSHAWTDDTLAYVWWGLAGIACAPVILTDRHKQKNGKIKTAP